MLTITYNSKKLYINIALLKNHFKSAFITLLKVSTVIFAVCGIFCIIGTAGASDNNIISFYQIFKQILQGGFLCGISLILNFIKNALQ